MLRGKIIVNPFKCPGQSVKQAQRLCEEFYKLGVDATVCYDAFMQASVTDGNLSFDTDNLDFIIFLDKDKYLASIIDELGVRMFNRANSIFICDDKGQTCVSLANKGVAMPKTLFAPVCYLESNQIILDFVDEIEKRLGYPVIVKSSYGSMGNGVFKADDRTSLISLMEKLKTQPHIFQEYLGKDFGTDVRVIVLGGKAVAMMKRVNANDFRSNVGQGGKGTPISLDDATYAEYKALAERCAKLLDLDYCGVDLLSSIDNKPVVCEVNSNAFFEEISLVTGVNVAKLYAEYVIKSLDN